MRFVVIDFEATCDEPHNADPQEIIEFPAVVVDPGGPSDGSEFHTHVRPVAHPRLPAFCTRLTGISQSQVDAAPAFPEVLNAFSDWWRDAAGDDALAVTCGDWDLGSLLPRQCAQLRLAIPAWADRWANLKRLYEWHFPGATDRAHLADIATSLGVQLEGRLHSGIDDARNIARVLRTMLGRGVPVENTAVWRCSDCLAENLQRDRACGTCGKPRVKLRPGGWHCPACGCPNFGDRDRCFDCGVRKPGGGRSQPASVKRGDWSCAACGEHNFARRDNCFKCGRRR
jgi:inhibitor of KinA sporulation pathway (predicted exonuclease)